MVVAIAGLLLSLGLPSLRAFVEGQRVRSAAGELQASLARARSEAVKRNTDVTLAATAGSTNWAGGWRIPNPAAPATFLEEHGSLSGVTLTGSAASVVFRPSGRLQAGASITFTASGSLGSTRRCVLVDLSGRPAVRTPAAGASC